MRFIHRVKQALGIMPIARFKAALFSRMVFLPIENAATPAVESILELHVFPHVEENARVEFFPLESSRGVVAEFVRIVHSPVDLLANLLAFLSKPVLQLEKTARREQFKNWLQR